jgi:hypothetical protein
MMYGHPSVMVAQSCLRSLGVYAAGAIVHQMVFSLVS